MVEPLENPENSSIRSSAPTNALRGLPSRTMPLSVSVLIYLRVLGWIVAILGVIAGIVMLANAPETQSPAKVIYLLISWLLLISSIAASVCLNVVAGIGNAILDIWIAQQDG